MKNQEIKQKWEEFIDEFPHLFISGEEKWMNILNRIDTFITNNDRLPSPNNETEKTDASWLYHVKKDDYALDIKMCKGYMKNEILKNEFENFMNKHEKLFKKYLIKKNDELKLISNIDYDYLNKYNCQILKNICDNLSIIGYNKLNKQGIIDLINSNNNNEEENNNGVEESKITAPRNDIATTKKMKSSKNKCKHLWKTITEDDKYCYKECEHCCRKTKTSREGKSSGYNEPNPDKKLKINSWLRDYNNYIEGDAIYLDAQDMKTSTHLIQNSVFQVDNLMIPEYDEDTYNINKNNPVFGSRVEPGDFLDSLKKCELHNMSLIYADFVGQYDTVVEPLLKYLQDNNEKVKAGTILGFTWSNNGVGSKNKRRKIDRDIGRFMDRNNYEEIEEVIDMGYGDGGQMNVMFLKKL